MSPLPRRPAVAAAGPLGVELGRLAEWLRSITVEIQLGRSGGGSGVIWREDGLVVTNAHVMRGAAAPVRLPDGRVLEGRTVARNPGRDLAALRVPAGGLAAALPGDVASLRPGELVVTLGHPLGVASAAALGVVHQVVRDEAGTVEWIRADVRLAPGNSGGPLADVTGRVLGLNTLVADGLGYAVPATAIARFLRRVGLHPPGERAA